MVVVKLDGFLQKSQNGSILITKSTQVDHRPQHKTECTEPDRKESGKLNDIVKTIAK